MRNHFALLTEADAGDGAGGGAPGGGSPKGGQDDEPKDGEVVSKKQFIAALNSAERKRETETAALRQQLAELQAQVKAKPADQPKLYTRAELTAAVEAGQISQEQADAQLQAQADDRAHRVALETVSAAKRKELIDSQLAQYQELAPEILDDDHDTRKAIKREFQALVDLGDDRRDVATQLKAVRAVLGPIERLKQAKSGRTQHEHHRETGGGGSGSQGRQKTGKLVDQLNADVKREYEKRIDRGIYKNWDEVESELKFASPATRQRLGIAA